MTERNVTREQAIICHLARVMGVEGIPTQPFTGLYVVGRGDWNPHHDRAQWAECVEWAIANSTHIGTDNLQEVATWNREKGMWEHVEHNNTHEGIRAATLEAIALATGWEGMEG
ncbi:MAG: hypothetical protein ABFD94_11065 [Armatimonadia bacterium]